MADKKIEKALYGPGTLEIALGAVLGLLVGVIAACLYLVFKPVQVVKEPPKEVERSVVYYQPGSTDAAKGRGWQAKQQTFVRGGELVISEAELNAWAASVSPGAAPAGAAKPGSAPASGDFISASGLNFRLEGERLHVGQTVLLDYFGLTKEVIMQASGGFVRTADGFVFKPDRVYLGSCPLHLVPGAAGALTSTLRDKQKVPDEFRAAWSKVSEIAVDDGLLKVTTLP